ncbi:MAG: YvcK family protein [Bacilli bacterium]|nr:YvcK family protein [Bacilli bacterium]MDD4282324.1 YvcK family protein [Bacilli bacterium]MDD4718328.1 YvcK family protein [Bacilli bacterium]
MKKKIVVLGGGTGMSTLLSGLKMFPIDISAVVSVSDDGSSTGRLREEFNIPAVGDIRRVLVSLSETEPLFEKLLNYRFNTTSDLHGHTVGNLLLTAASNVSGNMSDGIEMMSKVLNLKGKVVPLTEDNVVLLGKMEDGSIIEGEHNLTNSNLIISDVFYKENPTVNPNVIKKIAEADLILLSMGSVFTSIIPNLVCEGVVEALEKSRAKIMYICNMMTQPGETDDFNVSHHIKLLNKYLGKRKIDVVIVNNGKISEELTKKYETLEQKDPVIYDQSNVEALDVEIIASDFTMIIDENIRHDYKKLASYIFLYLI